MTDNANAPEQTPEARRKGVWVASTYFAEGFPYAVVHTYAEVLFKEMGASLSAIGMTSLFHLPWNLKFLWGPFLDGFATKRRWLIALEVFIVAAIGLMALTISLPNVLTVISALFVVLAFLSATHDIAIDGYYLEALNKDDQSRYVGFRASAYRIAMFVVGGPMLMVIGKVGWFAGLLLTSALMAVVLGLHLVVLPKVESEARSFADLGRVVLRARSVVVGLGVALLIAGGRALFRSDGYQSWRVSLYDAQPWLSRLSTSSWIALTLLVALLGMLAMLPWAKRRLSASDSFYAEAYIQFLEQPGVGRILAFIILFRTGESFLTKMRFAFLNDVGMTTEAYGFAYGTVGVIAAFVSTLVGGWLIAKHGLKRWVWPMVLAQNLLNLLFMLLAQHAQHLGVTVAPAEAAQATAVGVEAIAQAMASGAASPELVMASAMPHVPNWILTSVIAVESFGAGLGTAVFMVYIMRCCRSDYRAAHMAILTALMSLSFTIAGVMSGFLAEALGYSLYFGFTFVATLPGMALLFFVPYLDGTNADDACAVELGSG